MMLTAHPNHNATPRPRSTLMTLRLPERRLFPSYTLGFGPSLNRVRANRRYPGLGLQQATIPAELRHSHSDTGDATTASEFRVKPVHTFVHKFTTLFVAASSSLRMRIYYGWRDS